MSTLPPRPSRSGSTPGTFSANAYFEMQPAPENLEVAVRGVEEFIARQMREGRRVVLVTSGGTTVPLELNIVRFLDNFSAGTRGATSAEYFLEQGYAVIFMHRQFSQQPFLRHYSHSTNPFLNFLDIEDDDPEYDPEYDHPGFSNSSTHGPSNTSRPTRQYELPTPDDVPLPRRTPRVVVNPSPEGLPLLLRVIQRHKEVHRLGTLHTLTFVSVDDYLFLLRELAKSMRVLGRQAMYYLAAAVSDFFLPRYKMSEHKIQSGKGSLLIEMDQVPKILKPLVNEWTPEGYIVSFKLETDPALLIPKAKAALERYGHQVVIGNELHSRKYQVVLVERVEGSTAQGYENMSGGGEEMDEGSSPGPKYTEQWVRIREQEGEIEKVMIELLVKRHDRWIKNGAGRKIGGLESKV